MIHKHQQEMENLGKQIVELIEMRWKLFLEDVTQEEIKIAYEMLTDDPHNTLSEIMDPTNACGMWFIPEEVICVREMEETEQEPTS